jgi:metallo-beta-lactamase family protein
MRVTFLGAAGTVTGSRYLVEAGSRRLLVDCGLFQGVKVLRRRNWAAPPVEPASLDAVLLTHAHLDHSGYLPALVRQGFHGPIYATPPTIDLCGILLPDAGRLQEEDAEYANRKGFSRHRPALPLYTEEDARRVLPLFRPLEPDTQPDLNGISVDVRSAGHILGAVSLRLEADRGRVLFSGDLGGSRDPIIPPPAAPAPADRIVMESTYGDRVHEQGDPVSAVAAVLRRTAERGGTLLVPSFAVGRAQLLLYCVVEAFRRGEAPRVPVYLNSPMAEDVSDLYSRHSAWHRLSREQCVELFRDVTFVRSVDESKALVRRHGPMVVVSASGMLTGGRVLHHLRTVGPDPASTILLVGYQAVGTRGAALEGGAERVKVHGAYVPIRCEVVSLGMFSAHADRDELLAWLGSVPEPPAEVCLVHGEPASADALRIRIEERLGWPARAMEQGETLEVAPSGTAARRGA